jgi:cation diffusion facilitator family transporter
MTANPRSPAARERSAAVGRVLAVILGLNLAVAIAKLIYGSRSGAIAISADGLHSLLDGGANVLGLISLAVSRKPPDADHPYGHRKFETFAALGIAVLLFGGCWEILSAAFQRLRHPRALDVDATAYVILGATLIVNLCVVAYERRAGRRLQSELLLSDAAHTGSDVLATVLVIASIALGQLGIAWADVLVAAVVVALILWVGVGILRGTISILGDERRLDPAQVEDVAMAEPGVLEVHNVRSRGAADDIHLDLHVLVHPTTPIAVAHAIGHRVEKRLRERWQDLTDVVVHVEPALEGERAHDRVGGGLRAEG